MEEISCEVYENEPAGGTLVAAETRSGTALWYTLEGGAGLFRINPAAGLIAAVAPLDYEAAALYNLTVTALSMVSGRPAPDTRASGREASCIVCCCRAGARRARA